MNWDDVRLVNCTKCRLPTYGPSMTVLTVDENGVFRPTVVSKFRPAGETSPKQWGGRDRSGRPYCYGCMTTVNLLTN